MRRIIKFGGTSIARGQLMRQMALNIKRLKNQGDEIIVVVSAMGGKTDELLSLFNQVSGGRPVIGTQHEVVASGEILSAKLMSAALQALGLKSQAITPENTKWPIYGKVVKGASLTQRKINQTDYALIDLPKTTERCHKAIEPLLAAGITPVVCGFLAKDKNGKVITLGRGGSDITVFLLGRCLAADEIIIVTDVAGVLKGDPKRVKSRKHIAKISLKELERLSAGGAQVIHPAALQYKLSHQKARIIHFMNPNFQSGGTELVGAMRPEVFKTKQILGSITIVGERFLTTAGLLNKITTKLAKTKCSVYGVSISENYLGIYVPESFINQAYRTIFALTHKEKRFKAVSVRKGIGQLRISTPSFIEEAGVIGRIGDLLAREKINIIEMMTILSDITVFVEKKDMEKAYRLIKKLTI